MMQVARRQSAAALYGKAALPRPLSTSRRASDVSQQRSRQNSGTSSLAAPSLNAVCRRSASLEIPGQPARRMSASSHTPDVNGTSNLAAIIRQGLRSNTPSPTGSDRSYSPGAEVYFNVFRDPQKRRSTSYNSVQSAISDRSYTSEVSSSKDNDQIGETGITRFPDLPVLEVKPPSVKSKDSSSTTSSERRQRARGLSDLSATSNYSCTSQRSAISSKLGPAYIACDAQEYIDLVPYGPYTRPTRSRSNTIPITRSRSSTLSAAARREEAYNNALAWATGTDPSSSFSGDSIRKVPKKGKGKVRKGFSSLGKALGMSKRR